MCEKKAAENVPPKFLKPNDYKGLVTASARIILTLAGLYLNLPDSVSFVAIGVMDMYLVAALVVSARITDKHIQAGDKCGILPNKFISLLVVLGFALTLIVGFAHIYYKTGHLPASSTAHY